LADEADETDKEKAADQADQVDRETAEADEDVGRDETTRA
jgi:hypothetical protein